MALLVEKEELRLLAVAVRNFSARMNTMPARPVWQVDKLPVDINAAFYSGPKVELPAMAAICHGMGLEIMNEPTGESFAAARWQQVQQALTTVFDLLTELGLHPQGTIVERNREIVDREVYQETRLSEGDTLELVRLVGGG